MQWVDIDTEMTNGHGSKDHIIKAIKQLKGIGNPNWKYGDQSYRLMFGTDAPLARFKNEDSKKSIQNYTQFIEDIKYAIRTDKDLAPDSEKIIDDLFYNNAVKLYLAPKKKSNNLLILILSSVIVAAVATILNIKHQNNDKFKMNYQSK